MPQKNREQDQSKKFWKEEIVGTVEINQWLIQEKPGAKQKQLSAPYKAMLAA